MYIAVVGYDPLLGDGGLEYRPRAYAGLNSDKSWSGFLVFFPLLAPQAAVSTTAELTTPTIDGITNWARALSAADLRDALSRALALDRSADVDARLAAVSAAQAVARTRAAEDAEAEAELAETAANAHETIATAERLEAQELRDEARLHEEDAASAIAARAQADAAVHAQTARQPRTRAADVGPRRATPRPRRKRAPAGSGAPRKKTKEK